MIRLRGVLGFAAGAAAVLSVSAPRDASAQQAGYTADRLILAPNPDDGFASMRPVMAERTRFFGSLTADYIRRPLKISNITDKPAIQNSFGAPISNQATAYGTAGAEILGRFSLSVTMPLTFVNTSNNPSAQDTTIGAIQTKSAAAGDLRLDGRVILYTSDSKKFSTGIGATYFVPTGNDLSFAGDGEGHSLFQILFEERLGPFIVNEYAGVHLRGRHNVGTLSFQNELTFGGGIFIPLRSGRVRVGGEIFGQTGLSKTRDDKSTFGKSKYTPVEWLGEVRVALDEKQHAWFSGGAGTLVYPGYSAPDFRVIAQIGYWFDIKDTDPPSPGKKFVKDDERVAEHAPDRDGDGIPDSIDACPDVPEDHQPPDPNDGCPAPADRDKDGIPDNIDKCPDVPEDKDGIDDQDGCPEDDVDADGIPDVQDACPREPGQPSKDPKQNGCPQFIRRIEGSNEIQILKKIEFDTAKATIKPVSFPILDEVVRLLKANPSIKKVSIEGHTDSRGARDMNMKLSDDRSKSVMQYLIDKGGIDAGRLSAQGFGPDKPVDDNKTDAGRQKNRRVEFHIVELRASAPFAMRRILLPGVALALAACVAAPPPQAPAAPAAPRGQKHAVASENATATHAAMDVLDRGGNAVDAAIAAAFMLGVTVPVSSGIGGGGFALVWDAKTKKSTILDFRETAPAKLDPAAFESKTTPSGALVGVPGEVAGLAELHRRWGTKTFAECAAPAADAAERGFPISPHMARALTKMGKLITGTPAMASIFLPGGTALRAGATAQNPALAATLRTVGARGPAAFYEGPIAESMAAAAQRAGGTLTVEDLRSYKVLEREPLRVAWEGHEVMTMPPPSAGGVMVAELLGMFSAAEAAALDPRRAEGIHTLAEAMRGAFADRVRGVGDPAYATVDVPGLLAAERLKKRRASIDPNKTRRPGAFVTEDHGTSHLIVIDAQRNVVALTTTVNNPFGARIVADGTGILLNDELNDFTRLFHARPMGVNDPPGSPRALARPPSSMTPTVVLKNGEPVLVAGGSGGLRIATGVSQVTMAVLARGLSARAAVTEPRVHVSHDGTLVLEPGAVDAPTREDLARRGEALKEDDNISAVQAVSLSPGPSGWWLEPAADPRKFGLAEAR